MFSFILILLPLVGVTWAQFTMPPQNFTTTNSSILNQTTTSAPYLNCWNYQCLNGGSCMGSWCYCFAPYSGQFCEFNLNSNQTTSNTTSNCSSVNCYNGGSCLNGFCLCPYGYSGQYCETSYLNRTSTSWPTAGCQWLTCYNGGLCFNGYCMCTYGFTGQYCEYYSQNQTLTTSSPSDCWSGQCLNGGSCMGYSCWCPSGFSGRFCESYNGTDQNCTSISCMNGGSCYSGICVCQYGFMGRYCENYSSYCMYSRCQNGGSCLVDYFGNPSCSCPFGYSGTYCETKTACTYLSCQNGGTCVIGNNYVSLNIGTGYYYTDEYCKCSSNYTGLLCDIRNELPAMIFTPDEQCQQVLGNSFIADRTQYNEINMIYNSYSCSYLSCISLNEVNSYVGIVPSNGTLCAPGALCMSGQCVNITNAPQTVYFDNLIGSKSCLEYLSADKNYANSLCSTSYGQKRCPTACKKYSLLKCNDTLNECSQLGSFCKTNYPGTNTSISDLCPFTCNSAKCGFPLKCSSTVNLCMNGGKCANVTGSRIGFKCTCVNNFTGELCESRNPCLPNPCRSNRKCNKIGAYAFVCS